MKIITIETTNNGTFTFPCLEVAQSCGNIRVLTNRIACADGSVHNEFFSIPRGVVTRYESLADYVSRKGLNVSAYYPPRSEGGNGPRITIRSRVGRKCHFIMGWTMAECFSRLIEFAESSEIENFL